MPFRFGHHSPHLTDSGIVGRWVSIGRRFIQVGGSGPPAATKVVLNEKAAVLLEDYPPYEADDATFQNVINAMCAELERIEGFQKDLFFVKLFPANADDTYRTLEMWETLFGLPPKPAGVTLNQRRARVLASWQKRNSSAGVDWESAVTRVLGTGSWSYRELTGYVLEVSIPYPPGSYTAGSMMTFLRKITPAHLQINLIYGPHFLVEISQIGIDVI